MQLLSRERIAIIGSGGKTTLMTRLAQHCTGRVIMCTTTHLAPPRSLAASAQRPGADYPGIFIPFTTLEAFKDDWRRGDGIVLTARHDEAHQRLTGLLPDEVDSLAAWPDVERLLVEADGSKRLPIKAHNDTEPVLFASCTLGIAVIGMKALGRHVCEDEVHRPELLRQVLNCDERHTIAPSDIAKAALAYLRRFDCARRALVISQCEHCHESELTATITCCREELERAPETWARKVEITTQRL